MSKSAVTELEVQALIMGMADDYSAALGEAMYLLVRSENVDAKGRWLAQSFLRNGMGAAVDIAAGPNPSVGLLDLLVLGGLQTWAFEKHWIPAGIGQTAGKKALERLHTAEKELWQSGARILSEAQLATLRGLVDRWIEAHPDRTVVSLVRFAEFTDQRRSPSLASREKASGLLAEVEEATAVIEHTQLLGERVLWFASRLPYILGQQVELTSYRIADQPEAAMLRDSVAALERLAETVRKRIRTLDADLLAQQDALFSRLRAERAAALQDLAERVTAARAAAISHAFDRLARERKELLDDLENRGGALRSTMTELRDTVHASGKFARDLTGTVDALDRVIARFDRSPGDDRKPLDIGDVTAAAAEASRAAERLTELLDRTNEFLGSPNWNTRLDRLDNASTGLIDRIFWRAVWVVLILVAGLTLMRLVPRRQLQR